MPPNTANKKNKKQAAPPRRQILPVRRTQTRPKEFILQFLLALPTGLSASIGLSRGGSE
jgi:hypothetical protein